ncbi:MgtC/SapB family protein [Nitrosomonas sp. Nm166]|uniref:MgtC/SapB family protein n=1 Tax=Nitrosomonas sp. Nm166 TaxID=1881054 RepID=UPI0008EF8859|nr:MgtC/SapB family protein [Nitrosomonas sp. Nm166]SFE88684.1 putative Mg2+ transporter-C (MgtC) family protein [Nitrosomonas sp. Nm166]
MDAFLEELTTGLPDEAQMTRIIIRLTAAALLGAVVGIQRERMGKSAGVRTHMLVALGTALFVITSLESGMTPSDLSRVIQGIAAGIGFIGAGAILKLTQEREITGLTTAAGIWMTAAVGVAVGLGRWGSAALGVILTWIILSIVGQLTHRMEKRQETKSEDQNKSE